MFNNKKSPKMSITCPFCCSCDVDEVGDSPFLNFVIFNDFSFRKSTRFKNKYNSKNVENWNNYKKLIKTKNDMPDDREKVLGRVRSLRSICSLGINEILFSYWHILHYPLFLLLVISGITHVVVVHFY